MVEGAVGEETLWLVCGLWLASGTWQRARGSSAKLWGWGAGPGLVSWGSPLSTRAGSPEPGSYLGFLNNKSLLL